MSAESKIEWTDATWNPVRGCTKISPGCAHCYAETFAERFRGVKGHPYEQGFDLRLAPDKLDVPLHWKKPRMIFVNMSDLFHEGVPDEFIDKVFAVMALCPQHTFQVLTKCAERMQRYVTSVGQASKSPLQAARGSALAQWVHEVLGNSSVAQLVAVSEEGWWEWLKMPNVWLGVSVENQKYADERIPHLLKTPAAVRFLSCEPLLGAVDLDKWIWGNRCSDPQCGDSTWDHACELGEQLLHWVIVGGESGPGSRPCDIGWIRSIIAQCKAAGVPCFVKQLGSKPVYKEFSLQPPFEFVGLKDFGTRPEATRKIGSGKGNDMFAWPEDLRVREMPTTKASVPA